MKALITGRFTRWLRNVRRPALPPVVEWATEMSCVSHEVPPHFRDRFVGVGYRMPGDPPGIDLDNSFSASLGTSYTLTESSVLIFSYDYAQATTDAIEDAHELFAGYSAPLFGRVNWTVYGIAGLSDGSPDAEGGVLLSIPFN